MKASDRPTGKALWGIPEFRNPDLRKRSLPGAVENDGRPQRAAPFASEVASHRGQPTRCSSHAVAGEQRHADARCIVPGRKHAHHPFRTDELPCWHCLVGRGGDELEAGWRRPVSRDRARHSGRHPASDLQTGTAHAGTDRLQPHGQRRRERPANHLPAYGGRCSPASEGGCDSLSET